jgi:hypothetical protein
MIYFLALFFFVYSSLTATPSSDIDELIKQHECNVSTVPSFNGQFFALLPEKIELINADQLVVKDIDTVETEAHKRYLTEIGLGERAQGIQVSRFQNFLSVLLFQKKKA